MLTCIILLIYMITKKRREKKMSKEKNEENVVVTKETKDLLPDIRYDSANECYVKQNGECIDFIKIKSKDLVNSSNDEIEYDQYRYMKFYMTYADDVKIICMNFPCDTQQQQSYLQKKINSTNNYRQKYWLQKRLDELEWVEKNRTTREYYYMIFSKNIEEHLKNKTEIVSALGSGRNGLIEFISEEEKRQVFYKMNNKSSLIS